MSTSTTQKKLPVLPSMLRNGSSAYRIYHAAAAGGWTLDLHGHPTHDGKSIAYFVLVATDPGAKEGHVVEARFEFDRSTGAILGVKRLLVADEQRRRIYGNDKPYRHPGDSRQPKVADLVQAMGHGPLWRKAREAEAAEKAALAQAKWQVRQEEMRIVGSQPVTKEFIASTKRDRNAAVNSLRGNLEAIIERATKALASLDEGILPDSSFPVLGQAGYQVDMNAGNARALAHQVDRMESMFGEVTQDDGYVSYHAWQSLVEKQRAAKKAEEEA